MPRPYKLTPKALSQRKRAAKAHADATKVGPTTSIRVPEMVRAALDAFRAPREPYWSAIWRLLAPAHVRRHPVLLSSVPDRAPTAQAED
jgi:hypothetical protein